MIQYVILNPSSLQVDYSHFDSLMFFGPLKAGTNEGERVAPIRTPCPSLECKTAP